MRIRLAPWFVLLGACASTPPPPPSAPVPASPPPSAEESAEVRRRLDLRSDGRLTGRIARVDEDALVVRPFDEREGTWQIEFSRHAAVFRDGARFGTEVLREGDAVRVFFENRDLDGASRVTAVDLLAPDEVRRLEQGIPSPADR